MQPRRRGAGTAAAQRRFPVPGLATTGPGGLGHRRSPPRAAGSGGCIQPMRPVASSGSGCAGGEAAWEGRLQVCGVRGTWGTHSRVPSSSTPRRRRARVSSRSSSVPRRATPSSPHPHLQQRHAPSPSFLATLRPWRCAARGHAPGAPPQAAPEETGWEKLHLAAEPLLFPL